ncbi:MAG: hypothetical protein JWM74_1401 [Myxococcaceae bacterium]|nr:hypothetical protein [Myxococcaceae bacterium]
MRPELGDAGADAASGDASADAGIHDAALDSAPVDAALDASDAGPCAALHDDVVLKRKKARECNLGTSGQCSTTVKDECNCDVVIRNATSAETNAYKAAVSALTTKCAVDCSAACPQIGLPASWACLNNSGDIRCTP